ncbi:hypothetical protein KM043_006541 [Ampulex compressa]|nr:hypothetical protein KM043_006541 [Ampulex compressa]
MTVLEVNIVERGVDIRRGYPEIFVPEAGSINFELLDEEKSAPALRPNFQSPKMSRRAEPIRNGVEQREGSFARRLIPKQAGLLTGKNVEGRENNSPGANGGLVAIP